jgi:ribosomal protein S18 acetylase RimI-like enzyme
VDRPCPELVAEVDRLYAGFGHRKVLIEEDALSARVGPELRAAGYGERSLIALAREPGGIRDPSVRAVSASEITGLRKAVIEERLVPAEPSVVEQLLRANLVAEGAGGQWLALFERGRPVAACIVFSHQGLAQIEDVAVREAFRGRGLARRLLGHALAHVADDHDAVMIVAEEDEWPLGFYERLGFGRVEERRDYTLVLASG